MKNQKLNSTDAATSASNCKNGNCECISGSDRTTFEKWLRVKSETIHRIFGDGTTVDGKPCDEERLSQYRQDWLHALGVEMGALAEELSGKTENFNDPYTDGSGQEKDQPSEDVCLSSADTEEEVDEDEDCLEDDADEYCPEDTPDESKLSKPKTTNLVLNCMGKLKTDRDYYRGIHRSML